METLIRLGFALCFILAGLRTNPAIGWPFLLAPGLVMLELIARDVGLLSDLG